MSETTSTAEIRKGVIPFWLTKRISDALIRGASGQIKINIRDGLPQQPIKFEGNIDLLLTEKQICD